MPSQWRGRLVFLHSEHFSPAQSGRRGGGCTGNGSSHSIETLSGKEGLVKSSTLYCWLSCVRGETKGRGREYSHFVVDSRPTEGSLLSVWTFGSGP